jgi:hypothetical protein
MHKVFISMSTLVIVSIFLLLGCQDDSTSKQEDDALTLSGPYMGQEPPGLEPVMFAPGLVSTGLSEAVCNFAPGGAEAYWNFAYDIKKNSKAVIVSSRMENGRWTSPEIVEFEGMEQPLAVYPFLSYDGKELYFVSDQPINDPELTDDYNLWVARKEGDRWSTPTVLPYPVNGNGNASGPSITNSGVLYYTIITDKEQAIYRSRQIDSIYSEPEKLPEEVNSTDNQFDGVISPDESYMILPVHGRSDSYGSIDLYITFRDDDDNWTPVVNMGEVINTERVESAARISPDGKYIFLTGLYINHDWGDEPPSYSDVLNYFREPGYGRADIYWISADYLDRFR